jgi:4-hydroxybenzoate polyprenyltransferase
MKPYMAMARPTHWVKNLFILPGFCAAQMFRPNWSIQSIIFLFLALASTSLIASSNYVVNEWLDANSDAFHPEKESACSHRTC